MLLTAYLCGQALALATLWSVELPWWLAACALIGCLAHACWVIPRRILLTHPDAVTGLRRDARGWQAFSRACGWERIRLCRDSVALPRIVVLRFVRDGRRVAQSQCIPRDTLTADEHRRLRVRLKFSRRRWVMAPE
nr:protein YgfX [Pseudomonas putida]